MEAISVTQLYCPNSPGNEGESSSTHHLVPRPAGGGLQQQTCRYCGKTEKQLRDAAEKA